MRCQRKAPECRAPFPGEEPLELGNGLNLQAPFLLGWTLSVGCREGWLDWHSLEVAQWAAKSSRDPAVGKAQQSWDRLVGGWESSPLSLLSSPRGISPWSFCKQSVRGRKRALVMSSPAGSPPDHYLGSPSPGRKDPVAHMPAWRPGHTACPLSPPTSRSCTLGQSPETCGSDGGDSGLVFQDICPDTITCFRLWKWGKTDSAQGAPQACHRPVLSSEGPSGRQPWARAMRRQEMGSQFQHLVTDTPTHSPGGTGTGPR